MRPLKIAMCLLPELVLGSSLAASAADGVRDPQEQARELLAPTQALRPPSPTSTSSRAAHAPDPQQLARDLLSGSQSQNTPTAKTISRASTIARMRKP
jgi:hypothetical protein